jgi:DNA-directed RNA polymerase subunit RPC12/RpoP
MPIQRSYMCRECGHHLSVTLTSEEWDAPAPECPKCANALAQEFKPVAIGGSARSKAEKITEDILAKDFNVADIQRNTKPGSRPEVRYNSPSPSTNSTWGIAQDALRSAMAAGRQTRIQHGNGLDVLQQNLKSGAEPDLIELSKRRAMRIY